MNKRLFYCFILACFLTASASLQAASLQEQRNYYDEAKKALTKGNPLIYYSYKKALADYPLEPYLAYMELNIRLAVTPNTEVEQFLKEHADLPHIKWLEMRWLRLVAQRGEWNTFLTYYKPETFSELDCLYAQYLYQHKKILEANKLAQKLWLKPYSQPNACDAVFNTWQQQGQLTNTMRWQRLKLAVEAKEYKLANHLANQLTGETQLQAKVLINVAQSPELISKTSNFQTKDNITSEIISLGLRRLARKDPEQALQMLKYYGTRLNFTKEQKIALANDIGLTFARRFDARALPILAQYDANLDHNDVSEWHIRLLLRLGYWQQALQLIERLPESLANSNRWTYWKIRSTEIVTPKAPEIIEHYKQLAKQRDFYGFLAAQRIGVDYNFNNHPIIVNNSLVMKVKSSSAVQRAIEFQLRGMDKEAWFEWSHVARQLSKQEMLALSQLAYDMRFYYYAIRTLATTNYWDDLNIRFPLAYKNIVINESKNRSISPNWALAIMRQESAFNERIKSHAGAMGLMQLMPGTARQTAQKFDIPLAKLDDTLEPKTNIQLGTAYLAQVYSIFQNNRILASAAYNAGPARVKQWLKDSNHLDFDVWIETIPFNETRQYVQNILFYTVIYGHKLNISQPLIEHHEISLTND